MVFYFSMIDESPPPSAAATNLPSTSKQNMELPDDSDSLSEPEDDEWIPSDEDEEVYAREMADNPTQPHL